MIMTKKCWLDEKTVIVTGAAGGMGAGITASLIKQHGCKVIGIDLSEERMLSFIEDLGDNYKNQFSYKLFDVSSRENWENLANELKENGTKIDILINNAGILPKFKRFDRYSYEEIERAMNINFYSCIYSIKSLLPLILESPNAAIINIDSSAALMTLAGTSMYSASKSALKGLTEALRNEFKGKMYVSLVCPGFTKTNIFSNQDTEGNKKDVDLINMISTDCGKMVKMIMRGIERKAPMQVHGFDAHAMSVFNRIMPVYGSMLFSSVMKMAHADIFKEIFLD